MVYATVMPKGGCGKSTLCFNLTFSKAFQNKFQKITLIEMDRQGSLFSLMEKREIHGLPKRVDFLHLDPNDPGHLREQIEMVKKKSDCIVIDTAGESFSGIAAQYVMMTANRILIPCRSTTLDEEALKQNVFPLIKGILKKAPHRAGCYSVIPSMVHPHTNFENMLRYFREDVVPDWIELFRSCIVTRSILENFNREGSNLFEYREKIGGNKRDVLQVDKAIRDVEQIATQLTREVL